MANKRPSGCENCSKPCTIHLTQIVDGKIMKVDMCESCPKAKSVQESSQFDLMSQLLDMPETAGSPSPGETVCPNCGFSETQFQKLGRFGCAECYETFNDPLRPVLTRLHAGPQHKGKVPSSHAHHARLRELESLEERLQKSVDAEDYETAAGLRDEIAKLRTTLQNN